MNGSPKRNEISVFTAPREKTLSPLTPTPSSLAPWPGWLPQPAGSRRPRRAVPGRKTQSSPSSSRTPTTSTAWAGPTASQGGTGASLLPPRRRQGRELGWRGRGWTAGAGTGGPVKDYSHSNVRKKYFPFFFSTNHNYPPSCVQGFFSRSLLLKPGTTWKKNRSSKNSTS